MIWFILLALSVILNAAMWYLIKRGLERESILENSLVMIATAVDNVYREIQNVDAQGWFQNDDDVGFIFEDIAELVSVLHTIVIVEDGQQEEILEDDIETNEEEER